MKILRDGEMAARGTQLDLAARFSLLRDGRKREFDVALPRLKLEDMVCAGFWVLCCKPVMPLQTASPARSSRRAMDANLARMPQIFAEAGREPGGFVGKTRPVVPA